MYTFCYSAPKEIGWILLTLDSGILHSATFSDSELNCENREPKPSLCEHISRQLDEYFAGQRTRFSVPMTQTGTPFQKRCWNVLLQIPYGKVMTYQEEALCIGNRKASRAVAQANKRNNLPIFIPCHRVIHSDMTIGGYGAGVGRKKFLLQLEKVL